MNKSIFLIINIPLIINLMIIFLMMNPSNINKFHPMMLLIILILMTLLICIKMNYILKSLIQFNLFLIMIGGLMVIFMYITSLASNELFSLNYKYLLMNLIKISPLIIMLYYLLKYTQFTTIFFTESSNFNMLMNSQYKNNKNLNYLYLETTNNSTYFIMIYLYYTMICIMNICYKFKAPLRQLIF